MFKFYIFGRVLQSPNSFFNTHSATAKWLSATGSFLKKKKKKKSQSKDIPYSLKNESKNIP